MAIKDVKRYYDIIQNQYLEMAADAKDFDEGLKAGYIEQWQVDQAAEMTARFRENLDRWTAMILLLNEPAKKAKKPKYQKQNKQYTEALSGHNPADVIDENTDILKKFRQFVKENRDGTR